METEDDWEVGEVIIGWRSAMGSVLQLKAKLMWSTSSAA